MTLSATHPPAPLDPYPVSTTLLEERRRRAVESWQLQDEIVLVGSGEPIPIQGGADQTYGFRVHPHFRWLTGLGITDSVVAFDPREGWIEFLHRTTVAEKVWEGAMELERGRDSKEVVSWLEARAGRKIAYLGSGSPPDGVDRELSARLDGRLLHARRKKDDCRRR